MPTFDEWWNEQPIAKSPDSERVDYLRDMAHRVWISAQEAERGEWTKSTRDVTAEVRSIQHDNIMCKSPSLLSWGELLIRAQTLFVDNTTTELGQLSFKYLVRVIQVEEEDRRFGSRPNYNVDDVFIGDDWKL